MADMTKPGRHELSVMHPDYPVYRQMVRVTEAGRNLSINLVHAASDAGRVSIQMALAPPSDNLMLELVRHQRKIGH